MVLVFLLRNFTRKWNFWNVSKNPTITWEDICNNPFLPWASHCVSRNPNITWNTIDNNLEHKWDLWGLCVNSFTKDKDAFFLQKECDYFRNWYKNCVFIEEFMRVRFHPDNLNHFEDWGHSER